MTLSPRVGGATSKPVDVSPSPVAQRFASNSCVTTKMTYEFFNELIENFTLAQVAYGVTNVPNDPNALKKILDRLRTGGYNFTIGALGMGGLLTTNNNGVHIGTGLLSFAGVGTDYISFNDTTNEFNFFADNAISNSVLKAGILNINLLNVDTITEKTLDNGVSIESVLLKDGSVQVLGSGNYFGSLGDLNLVVDSNNNGTNQFILYNHSIATANQLLSVSENGELCIFSRSGSDTLKIIDVASTETIAKTYVSLGYNSSVGSTFNRIGVIGFVSNANQDLSIYNETTSGNIELVTNGQTSIKSNAGGDVLSIVDTNATTATLANPIISFDYSSGGGAKTRLGFIGFGSTGNTSLYLSNDSGDVIISPSTNIIDTSNSVIENSGGISFGNENLSLYRENVTFTATFYNGTTQITGSSGTSNVSIYDARFSRIGNVVTVNISNIVWSVQGNAGTTLGTYPAITTTGEFSIRGLPYNALKDACGSFIGFYNGSGNSNTGSVYIAAGTNSIRFSDIGFGGGFGIRGVTLTYMV